MEIIRIPRIVQDTCKKNILKGRSIGFVPTMGALHEGHLSLVRRAATENDVCVVSIFVNPTQFGPSEDFESYPRDMDNDVALLKKLEVDTLFIPDNSLMYPSGFATYVQVDDLSNRLCGLTRPGHFRGVATVVTKLLNIICPTRAYFGQKDFQQTVILRRVAKDLNISSEIVVCPTVREEDGLAMSSRNRYLDPQERSAAAALFRAMNLAAQELASGKATAERVRELLKNELGKEALISSFDYASLYDPETLAELQGPVSLKEVLIAIAARLGGTRLIDNMLVNLG